MVQSRIVRSEDGEILLLPSEVAFGEDVELTIVRYGDVLTIYPSKGTAADPVRRLEQLSPAKAPMSEMPASIETNQDRGPPS